MTDIRYIQSTERQVGEAHPTLSDTMNRALRDVLTGSGLDPDADFNGFTTGPSGTGSPEGVVTADVGQIYRQTDGAYGTTLWMKNSGSGNTGWRPMQTQLGKYNVVDYGAKTDGTDAATAINAALAALPTTPANGKGGHVVFPPGEYSIGSTITISQQGCTFGGDTLGGTTSHGTVTLKAMTGFTGPLVKVQVSAGDEGWQIQHLRLDGNSEAGVTAALEIAANTLARGYVKDVTSANCDTGLLTDDNVQSIVFTECYFNTGHATGGNITTDNRGLKFVNCVFGGTTVGLLVGPDDAVSGNRCSGVVLQGGEVYSQSSSPTNALIVRNTDSFAAFGTWFEHSGSNTLSGGVVQLGTATASAIRPMLIGCRFQANSGAPYNVEVVNANRPNLQGCGFNASTADVMLTYATSRAIILGLTCADPTGSALWLGAADGLLRFQGYGGSIRTTSTSGTVLISDRTLVIDDSGANKTMTLIAAASCKNQILTFIKGSASNKTTIDGNGSETIDGATTYVLRKQYEWVTIQSDGTAWYVLGAGLFPGSMVTASSTPADPTGTTSTGAFKMMGLAGSVTPKRSGTVWVSISGQMANSGAGDGVSVQLRMGTGSAPANADAVTGTQYGATQTATSVSAAQRSGFCVALPVTGLTVDTAYWIDAAVEAVTAGTATITGVTLGAVEL